MLGTLLKGLVILLIALGSGKNVISQSTLPPEVIAYADTVLHNGKILTADEQFTIAQAVAIRDGKFLAVGPNSRILAMAGPQTQRIDLRGKTVTPGFIDTHYHLDDYAMRDMLLQGKNIAWEGQVIRAALWWEDLDMALRDVKKVVDASEPGELVWMIARNEMRHIIAEMRMQQLDAISPENPVIISGPIRLGAWAINSLAIEWAKIPPRMPGLPEDGGAQIMGPRVEQFLNDILEWYVPIEEQVVWHKRRQQLANSWGLTLVVTRIEPSHFSSIRDMWSKDELTIRWRVAFPGELDPRKVGNLSDIGDDLLRIAGFSGGLSVGPSPMAGGVWSFSPRLRPLPGDETDQELEESQLPRLARLRTNLFNALRYGWSIPNTHVIGDRAAFEFLKIVEEAQNDPVVKSQTQRLTMDHLLQVRPQEIQKMKELGVIPSIAPWFLFTKQNISNIRYMFGADRANEMLPIKSYIEAGLRPALESDSGDAPLGKPLYKISHAVNRKDDDQGRVWNESEKVSRRQALWMSTLWASAYTGEQEKLGSIEPGKLADLIVMDKDYMTVPEDEIFQISIIMTVLGGKIVYQRSGELE